jgi:hypothetical protein
MRQPAAARVPGARFTIVVGRDFRYGDRLVLRDISCGRR